MTALLVATIVVSIVVLFIALYLGFKYPTGWIEWPHDAVTTVRYAVSGLLFLLILGLIYWITRYWDYPVGGKALAYMAFLSMFVLFVLGLIYPSGGFGRTR
jgi:hypothetical protein